MRRSEAKLLQKIEESHQEIQLPEFCLSEQATLILLQKQEGIEKMSCLLLPRSKWIHPTHYSSSDYKELVIFCSLFNSGNTQLLGEKDREDWDKTTALFANPHIIPVSILCSPKAYLVTDLAEGVSFNSLRLLLSEMLLSTMIMELNEKYQVDVLYDFFTLDDLVRDFAQELAHWLCPCKYRINDQEIFYYPDNALIKEESVFTLGLTENHHIIYHLPSSIHPLEDEVEEKLHQLSDVILRKKELSDKLSSYFNLLWQNWQKIRDGFIKLSDLRQGVQTVIEKYQQANQQLGRLTTVMTRGEVSIIAERLAKQAEAKLPQDSCSISHSENGICRIVFMGDEYHIGVSQATGILEILFSKPNQSIDPEDLYIYIQQRGLTYKKSSSAATKDATLDKVKRQELKASYGTYQPIWKEIEKKEDRYLSEEDLELSKYFLEIVRSLINFTDEKEKYIKLATQVKNRIIIASMILGKDDNFADSIRLIASTPKSGNSKNRTDSMNSSLRTLIRKVAEWNTDFSTYLDKTIIRNKEQVKKSEDSVYMFKPNYAQTKELKLLYWLTPDKDKK